MNAFAFLFSTSKTCGLTHNKKNGIISDTVFIISVNQNKDVLSATLKPALTRTPAAAALSSTLNIMYA